MEARRTDRRVTYEEVRALPEDVRVELIDGVVYDMAPAPHYNHQLIQGYLYRELANFLDGKPCRPFMAPTDVVLTEGDETKTIVQPDLFVVCDERQYSETGTIEGAPTFIAEILSPSSASRDTILKRDLYRRHGVGEYWIIAPSLRTVSRLTLENGVYIDALYPSGAVESKALPGFEIDVEALFAQMREDAKTEGNE